MNTEDPSPNSPRRPDSASGEPQGERRPRGPRRGPGDAGTGARGPGPGRADGSGRRGGDRRERGPRQDRGERGGRPARGGGRPGAGDPDRAPRGREAASEAAAPPNGAVDDVTGADNHLEALGGEFLASVSRSFSLTIRLLPEALREPVTLGYLLARAQDTVADTPQVAGPVRLEHLRALMEMVKFGTDREVLAVLQRAIGSKQEHEGERELIQELGRCLQWLESAPMPDRWDLRRTLARIGYAQELDLTRFGDGSSESPTSLATAAELDNYTYLIAGCVGELWTRLCQRHLPAGWSKRPEAEMLALGKRFGQGLQMVNILRDLPADLATGRCYLPADLLLQHGLTPADLTRTPENARGLLDALRKQAVEHLDAGWTYVLALTSIKLRYATALPVLLGLETLKLLAGKSPLETTERLKVSRTSVRKLMASAAVGAALSPWLHHLHGTLRRRALGAA